MRRRFICNYKIGIHDEIWYTSTDGNIVTPYSSILFGANIVSNTYSDGKGIIKFDSDVTSIGYSAFYNCSSLTSITIPNSVIKIDRSAFYDCSSLTSITIPDSVTQIGDLTFRYCTSLTSVVIPDSITSIGNKAFFDCYMLTSVTIPNSVTSIGEEAFAYCYELESVYCKPTTPPTLGSNPFYIKGLTGKIYVPMKSVNAYKTASGWSTYARYIEGYNF